jgi:rRNA maturation RNase YbeY
MAVDVTRRERRTRISVRKLKQAAEQILKILKRGRAELSLVLVGNREMQELNACYRHKNEPTDVLSFPLGGALVAGREWLGDVVISLEKARAQARAGKKTLEREVRDLLIHGILHLLGYDHERSAREARVMQAMEKKVSRALERFERSRS